MLYDFSLYLYYYVDRNVIVTKNDEYASILRAIENCKLEKRRQTTLLYCFTNFDSGNEKIDAVLDIAISSMNIKEGTSILHAAAEKGNVTAFVI